MYCVCLFVLVETRLLLAHQGVGWTLRLISREDWPQPQLMSRCVEADPMELHLL